MSNDALSRALANPVGLYVKEAEFVPEVGEKVLIIEAEFFDKEDKLLLCKLNNVVTVVYIHPIIIGEDGNYEWSYEIDCKEFPHLTIMGWDYKKLN